MGTTKLDLTKEYKTYYTGRITPEIIDFDEAQFLTIQGKGAPQSDEFMAKLEALYPLAYGIKMPMKKEGKDFTVAKLEGLWWVESSKPFMEVSREQWQWKLLIRMPEFVTQEIFERAKSEVENGLHHEIYLSDPRKVAPEKMKTILRQPVKEKE
jgi:hypothetical protein